MPFHSIIVIFFDFYKILRKSDKGEFKPNKEINPISLMYFIFVCYI